MSVRRRVLVGLAAFALLAVGSAGTYVGGRWFTRRAARAKDAEVSARLHEGDTRPSRREPGEPFDWAAVPYMLLAVGGLAAIVLAMAVLLAQWMPGAIHLLDTEDVGREVPAAPPEEAPR
jgi:hypothetical protein